MREIKFRAWIKEKKAIFEVILIDYVTKKMYKRNDNSDGHRILNVSDIYKGNGTVQSHFIFLFIRHHQI